MNDGLSVMQPLPWWPPSGRRQSSGYSTPELRGRGDRAPAGRPRAILHAAVHRCLQRREDMDIKRHQVGPRMSQAVVHNNTVYLAGQVAGDGSADAKGQTEQVLKKIDDALAAVGSHKSKLLTATVFLSDMANYDQ